MDEIQRQISEVEKQLSELQTANFNLRGNMENMFAQILREIPNAFIRVFGEAAFDTFRIRFGINETTEVVIMPPTFLDRYVRYSIPTPSDAVIVNTNTAIFDVYYIYGVKWKLAFATEINTVYAKRM